MQSLDPNKLEAEYIVCQLSQRVQKLIQKNRSIEKGAVYIQHSANCNNRVKSRNGSQLQKGTLIFQLADGWKAAQVRDASFHELLYMIGFGTQEFSVEAVRYQWLEPGEKHPQYWELGLSHTNVSREDLSQVEILDDLEIALRIRSHLLQTGMSGMCRAMIDSRVLFCADDVERFWGGSKSDLLRTDFESYYVDSCELSDYKVAVMGAKGRTIQVSYNFANIANLQICQHMVKAQLIRTSWGQLAVLELPLALPKLTGQRKINDLDNLS